MVPYEYPVHLREAVSQLPASPGVYIFHGEREDLPLYIGKSVNLRNRVLSHLRNPEEASMLRQARAISHITTVGEIGALLLEARLIKQQQPLFNQKLRRNRQLCALRLQDGRPEIVYSKDINFAVAPDLYGLYASRRAAIDALHELADTQRLCLGALGLEKLPRDKPCFRSMLNKCAGVCRGDETLDAHHDRLLASLQAMHIVCWPYTGAIGLIERLGDACQIHVIRNWCYLGSVNDLKEATQLDSPATGFDADGYKILCKPILSGQVEVISLQTHPSEPKTSPAT